MTNADHAICASYQAGMAVKHLLELHSIRPRQLYRTLRQAGIPLRQSRDKERNRAIACERFAGVPINDLAQRHRLSNQRVRQIVRVSGSLRPGGGV